MKQENQRNPVRKVVLVAAALLLSWALAVLPGRYPLQFRFALFAGIGGLIVLLVERARSAQRRAASLARELEQRNRHFEQRSGATERTVLRAERLRQFTTRLLERQGEYAAASIIVEDGRRTVEAEAAVIVAIGEDGGIRVLAAAGLDEVVLRRAGELYRSSSPLQQAVTTGEPVWVSDPAALADRYPAGAAAHNPAHHAWAALPLRVEQRTLGALGLSFREPTEFSADDRAFMMLVAQQCAQALDRARLYDLERAARVRAVFAERRLAFLADASHDLAGSLDYTASLVKLADRAVPEFADYCAVLLHDDTGRARLVAVSHPDADLVQRRYRLEEEYPTLAIASAGAGWVLRTGEIEHIRAMDDDVLGRIARDARHLELLRSFGIHEQITTPIRVDEQVAGVLIFALTDPTRAFDDADVTLAEELGRRAGQAVSNARLYQAAQNASEAKSNFLAVISHELRTPLNAIMGYSDLLLLGVPSGVPDPARLQVERVRVAAATLLHLVEEVLSFSRIEAGKEEIRISPVDLNALLRECAHMLEPMAAEKGLELRLVVPDDVVKIVSDERKIRQILMNLLSNAVKFTERGGIELVLASASGGVSMQVRDTGIGIPSEHLERIFDPFWQVEPASTRRYGGTGLGLGVARKLARLLGGQLEVESQVGAGSTFSLRLPARIQPVARSA